MCAADIVGERKKRSETTIRAVHLYDFGGNQEVPKLQLQNYFAELQRKGILKSGAFVSVEEWIWMEWDCVSAIREAFLAARGGVLFIDEAYAMKE